MPFDSTLCQALNSFQGHHRAIVASVAGQQLAFFALVMANAAKLFMSAFAMTI